ncbi:hypothetical protein ACVXG7_15250 [Enterobacter hormaechei]
MKQYLELMKKVLDEGTPKTTAPAPVRFHFWPPDALQSARRLSSGDNEALPSALDHS